MKCRVPADLSPLFPPDPESAGYDYDYDSEADDNPEVKDVDEADDNSPWFVGYTNPDNWILVTEDELESVELPVIAPIPYEP